MANSALLIQNIQLYSALLFILLAMHEEMSCGPWDSTRGYRRVDLSYRYYVVHLTLA